MSAEPARANGSPTTPESAAVIHLSTYGKRRPGSQAEPPVSDDPSPRQTLAEQVEAHFLKCGRTLTDEDTALAYEITLHIAMLILDGAREQDLMGEESYEAVHGLYANMVGAPQLL